MPWINRYAVQYLDILLLLLVGHSLPFPPLHSLICWLERLRLRSFFSPVPVLTRTPSTRSTTLTPRVLGCTSIINFGLSLSLSLPFVRWLRHRLSPPAYSSFQPPLILILAFPGILFYTRRNTLPRASSLRPPFSPFKSPSLALRPG